MSCVRPKMPAQRCVMRGSSPISSPRKRSSDAWIVGVVLLDVGELVHDRDVAEAAEQHAPVGKLLPVIEAVTRVVRPVVERRGRSARSRSPARASARSRRRAPARARGRSRRSRRRPASASSAATSSTRSCSRISAPASAARAASRRTNRAGWSEPSPAWRMPPSNRPASAARKIVDPLRVDAVVAQCLVLRLGSARAPPRRRRGGSCRAGAARRRRALPCGRARARSSARARAPARRRTSRARRRSAVAPPRSAKPPLRPLAPSATPRWSCTRTRSPASASRSAAEQPVMPAPTIATSTRPCAAPAGAAAPRLRASTGSLARI